MKKGRILCSAILALAVCFLSIGMSHAGSIPQLINYSGTLTDKSGAPVTGTFSVVFSIYAAPAGGTALWTERWDTTTTQITVISGVFNVMLGYYTPLPPTFFADNPTTYLGIKVGTDSEMTPRQQITSVGYAFNAGNGVPKGGVIMWSGAANQIPFGWVLCDGTNGTPDLRDKFVLGAGNTYAVAATGGEAMHTLTINEIPPHTHSVYISAGTSGVGVPLLTKSTSLTNTEETLPTGGGQPHNNMPPYYALAFIMKL